MDAIPLKIDTLASLVRQLGDEVKLNTAAIQAMTDAQKLAANSLGSMAEAFRQLTEKITAEPDEAENLGQMLRDIHHICTLIYARLPASARK